MNKKTFQNIIDQELSSLHMNEFDQKRMIQNIGKEEKMKKKLPFALVLAIILVLVTLSAMAAIWLSGKDFAENVIAPIAQEDDSEQFSREQLNEILRLADENGISMTDEMREKIAGSSGEYKEELMRAFVKIDLGFYPAQWSIKDQAWYDEMLCSLGLKDTRTRFVPEGNEITEAQMQEIVPDYIRSTYGDTVDVTNQDEYNNFLQYMLWENANGTACRAWDVEYVAKSLMLDSYYLIVSSSGEIMEDHSVKSAYGHSEDKDQWCFQVQDLYAMKYGGMDEWEMETWQLFAAEMRLITADGTPSPASAEAFAAQDYLIPDESALSKQAALTIAVKAANDASITVNETLPATYICLADAGRMLWKVTLRNDTQCIVCVTMDAHTGEVIAVRELKSGAEEWDSFYTRFVLDRDAPTKHQQSNG